MTTELSLKDVQETSVGIAKFSVVSVSNLGLLLPTLSALVPKVGKLRNSVYNKCGL